MATITPQEKIDTGITLRNSGDTDTINALGGAGVIGNPYTQATAYAINQIIWAHWNSNCSITNTCTSDAVWDNWNQAITCATSAYSFQITHNSITWGNWVEKSFKTEEERKAFGILQEENRKKAREEQMRYEAAQKIENEKRAKAKERAKRLLVSCLSPEQKEIYAKHGFFDVKIGMKTYRIRQGTHGNVRLLDSKGHEKVSYCIQPNGVPAEDAMLAQKLLLETDEQSFLRIANAQQMN